MQKEHLSVNRSNEIVARVEKEMASGDFLPFDIYPTFQAAGATSRLEALDALYISFADYYKSIAASNSPSPESLKKFRVYVSGSPAILLAYDTETNELFPELAQKETSSSFVDFLQTQDVDDPNYWPNVYARIGRNHSTENPRRSAANRKCIGSVDMQQRKSIVTKYQIWRARLYLTIYLKLTGFDYVLAFHDGGHFDSRKTEIFTKDDLHIVITSTYSFILSKYASIEYPTSNGGRRVDVDTLTAALNAVKAAFPDEKPNVIRYLLKPICIKIFLVLGGILIFILIIRMGAYVAEYIRGQCRFVKAPISLIGVAVAGIVCILNTTRQLFMRIALAVAWLGILTWFAWRFLLIH